MRLYFSLFQTCAIGIIGDEKYGVLSLRGKFKSFKKGDIVNDGPDRIEVRNIFMALGLTYDVTSHTYVFDVKKLRYAKVLMMLDQVLHHKSHLVLYKIINLVYLF